MDDTNPEAKLEMCPRRKEIDASVFKVPAGPDTWSEKQTCSYCGSLHPDEFMKRIEAGDEVGPTDKNYKAYLGDHKFYFQHLSEDQKTRFVELLNQRAIKIGYPRHFYVLPFFVALGEPPKGGN